MKRISPSLWFNNQAEEATQFYCTVFKNSRILSSNPMSVTFELEGQQFIALNGGPKFTFNKAVSFFVSCVTQEEIEYYWKSLTNSGGQEGRCGWLKDKYGLSWQIIPAALGKLMGDPNKEKPGRVIQAKLKMKKIMINDLQMAYNGA